MIRHINIEGLRMSIVGDSPYSTTASVNRDCPLSSFVVIPVKAGIRNFLFFKDAGFPIKTSEMTKYISMSFYACFIIFSFFIAFVAHAAELKTVKPDQKDKCPVCGMFVAKYPDFVAGIVFKDGSHAVFDGTKDMFKYYFNLKKYNPSKKPEDIETVFVTEYYGLNPVDARKAFFVSGSDVHGPMGRELIPFEKMPDAASFMKDHRGRRILKFSEITPDIIKKLD